MEKHYVYFETYGCSANLNNTEIMKGILMQNKFNITNNPKLADILVFNTCIVKGKTEQKIKRKIQDLSIEFPNKLIIVSGCMPETNINHLKKLNNKIIFLGINHIKDIVNLIRDNETNKLDKEKQKEYLVKRKEEKLLLPKIPDNPLISIIQISEGCLGNCSYCKTKLAKGDLYSYPKDRIIKAIQNDLNNGAKEIWLTSQDNASFGLDRDKHSQELPDLLKDILNLKQKFKLRLGMMNPNYVIPIKDELIEIFKNKKMYKFLHIPIQSASNKILKDMNRFYKIEEVETILSDFKKQIPDITIATDIITGYPTEQEIDHKKNIDFINKFVPDVLNLSKFSSHKGTKANLLPILEKEIINNRASELMAIHRKTSENNKQKFKEKTIQVFINKKTEIPGVYEARAENYNIILINSKDKSILGKTLEVKIKSIGVHHMIGELK